MIAIFSKINILLKLTFMKQPLRFSVIAFLFLYNFVFAQESTESAVINCENFTITRLLRELI